MHGPACVLPSSCCTDWVSALVASRCAFVVQTSAPRFDPVGRSSRHRTSSPLAAIAGSCPAFCAGLLGTAQLDTPAIKQSTAKNGRTDKHMVPLSLGRQAPTERMRVSLVLEFRRERHKQLPSEIVVRRVGIGRTGITADVAGRDQRRILIQDVADACANLKIR
jgi:hypothetical protein